MFQAIDNDASTPEIDSKRDTLNLAAEIFSRSSEVSTPSLQTVVEQGSKIIAGLFRAAESRRMARAARHLLSATGGSAQEQDEEDELETFAEVLQRISRSLNSQSAPHRGTPPPTRNIPSAQRVVNGTIISEPLTNANQELVKASNTMSGPQSMDGGPFDFGNPWPFPNANMAADDLSISFLQELDFGLPDSSILPQTPTMSLWNQAAGTATAFGDVVSGTSSMALPAAAMGDTMSLPLGNPALVRDGWNGQAGGGAEAGTAPYPSLLDQLGGGW